MFKCDVCGSEAGSLEHVREVFEVEGKQVLVEH